MRYSYFLSAITLAACSSPKPNTLNDIEQEKKQKADLMPAGFRGQLTDVKRSPGVFYRNADGQETMSVPRWVLGVFLASWAVLALVVALFCLAVLNTLADLRAYQSTTYAQCKAAAAVCEKQENK